MFLVITNNVQHRSQKAPASSCDPRVITYRWNVGCWSLMLQPGFGCCCWFICLFSMFAFIHFHSGKLPGEQHCVWCLLWRRWTIIGSVAVAAELLSELHFSVFSVLFELDRRAFPGVGVLSETSAKDRGIQSDWERERETEIGFYKSVGNIAKATFMSATEFAILCRHWAYSRWCWWCEKRAYYSHIKCT